MIVLVTGVPASGKTVTASLLAKTLKMDWREINDDCIENSLYLGYDHQRGAYIIDEEQVSRFYTEMETPSLGMVLSGAPISFPEHFIDLIVVLHADPADLRKRMEKRRYPEEKIQENIDAELISVILGTVLDQFPGVPLIECDTSEKKPAEIVENIVSFINRIIG
ncbi:MAG: AAA family ATPase [Candidatus Hodarchaeales archaeon]